MWLVVPLVVLACSGHDIPAGPIDNGDGATEVTISNFAFAAPTLTIALGEIVVN